MTTTPAPVDSPRSSRNWSLPLLGVVGMVTLTAGSWIPAWSRDEAATVLVVRRPLAQVWRSWAFDPALEPFYLLTDLWAVASTSELWLRLPSVFAMVVAALILTVVARRFVGPRAAALGGLLLLVLPATTRYGQEARPYAATMLLATLVIHWWLADRQLRGWSHQVRLVVTLLLIGLTHAYALLILGVLLVVALIAPEQDRRREVTALLRIGVLTTVLLSPYLWLLVRGARGAPDPAPLTVMNLVVEFVRLPAGVLRPPGAAPVGALVLIIAAGGIVLGLRRGGAARTGAVLALTWLVLPPAALCAFQAITGSPGLVARYWTFCLPAVALAATIALEAAWRRHRSIAIAALVLVGGLGLPAHLDLRGPNGHAGHGWAQAVDLLDRAPLADAAVVVEGSIYRTLIVHDPAIAQRMPLVVDPAPAGRIQPLTAGRQAPEFDVLRSRYSWVVVLQNRPGTSSRIPELDDLPVARAVRRDFPRPAVLCSYFGDPLAVLTTAGTEPDPEHARQLAELITAVGPDDVHCAPTRTG